MESVPELKAELFKALAHPARIRVLELLCEGERSVGEMQPDVAIEFSHLSHQLSILRRADLVTTRRVGNTVIYALKDPRIAQLLGVARQILVTSLEESRALLSDLHAEVEVG